MWRIILVVWLASVPGRAFGWAWSVHRLIAFRAMRAVADELPLDPARAWPVLYRGAVAPDAKGPGNLPPQDHVFHVDVGKHGKPFGNGPRRIQELTWRLMSAELPDDEVVFELGRICHLVGDLAQPLHTDGKRRNPDEDRFHPIFERAADADPELAGLAPAVPPATTPAAPWLPENPEANNWESRMEALARESWKDYDAIGHAFARELGPAAPGYPATREIVKRRVARAILTTVELWRAILARRGRAERVRRESAAWAWFAVPFVLLWFLIRGRVRREESRWPGREPASAAEKRRSDRAFRGLAKRLGVK